MAESFSAAEGFNKLATALGTTESEAKKLTKTNQELTVVLGRQAQAYMTLDVELIKNRDAKKSINIELLKEQKERKKLLTNLKQDIIERSKNQQSTISELRARDLNNMLLIEF